ncbi:hypothetical protein NE237_011088 [Protea cynaroides]|uniref:Major facilitator superfamily (MFS) profile domain-containing protein n=1 Tax=Protea cynaroides TaxID=273540 RepID=A0A9Q0JXM1_9MAGN|nr:hypothetical protein NE237_011088 [Protea cynaroides]
MTSWRNSFHTYTKKNRQYKRTTIANTLTRSCSYSHRPCIWPPSSLALWHHGETWMWLLAGGSSVPIGNRSGEDPRVAEHSVPTMRDNRDPSSKLGELCRGGHPPSWMEDSSGACNGASNHAMRGGIIGIILLVNLKPTGSIGQTDAVIVVLLVCLFVMCFAWSWGPLGWLIPSETFPLETRTAGFSFAVSANMLFTFIIAQSFLSMLCKMQAGIFFFFAAWILVGGVFSLYLMPETKGVPVDDMVERVWKQHWFWKSYMTDDNPNEDLKQRKLEMVASTSRN